MRARKLLAPLTTLAVALAVFSVLDGDDASRAGEGSRVARAPVLTPPNAGTGEQVDVLRAALRRGPGDPALLAQLGNAELQLVRETGDARGYPRADRALRAALARDPRDVEALTGKATLEMARHHFADGLRHAERAAAVAPQAAGPLPVLVDALVELGRLDDATRVLQRLLDRKPGLPAYSRASYLRELRGDLDGAASAMRFAADAAGTPEARASVLTLLGTLERNRGRRAAARTAWRAALAAVPGTSGAVAGLAALDAGAGRLTAAVRRLRAGLDPLASPEYAIALGEHELAAGRTRAGRRHLALAPVKRAALRANGENTDTESAQFEADHGDPAEAVRLARRAWAAAPSVRSADALGWALTRAGRAGEGWRWAQRALRDGWRDPVPVFHAGLAAKAAGDRAAARRLLRGLLARTPDFSALHAPRARRALADLR